MGSKQAKSFFDSVKLSFPNYPPETRTMKGQLPGMGVISVCEHGRHCSCEQVRSHSKLRHSFFNLTLHLFDVDVQSIAIDRAVGFEVEDSRDCVAADRLLVD